MPWDFPVSAEQHNYCRRRYRVCVQGIQFWYNSIQLGETKWHSASKIKYRHLQQYTEHSQCHSIWWRPLLLCGNQWVWLCKTVCHTFYNWYDVNACIHAYSYTCMCTHMHTHIHRRIHRHIHTYIYMLIHITNICLCIRS